MPTVVAKKTKHLKKDNWGSYYESPESKKVRSRWDSFE
jgi:hypothetical protein